MTPGSVRAAEVVGRFPSCRVLVVGDIMLDEYVFGTVGRISPEAPVPVVAVTRETKVPGGAANVAFNLRGLGTGVELAGLLGDDAGGRFVARMLKGKRVGVSEVVVDPDRPTTVKTRVIAHSQQVVRVDRERNAPPSRKASEALRRKVLAALDGVDGVVFSDYRKGALTFDLVVLGRRPRRRTGRGSSSPSIRSGPISPSTGGARSSPRTRGRRRPPSGGGNLRPTSTCGRPGRISSGRAGRRRSSSRAARRG